MFKRICAEADAGDGWTPRELRTTFVSLMSHQGVAIEEIARLAGHATTRTTEIVCRGPALHLTPRGMGDTADQGAWRTEICWPIFSTGPAG